MTEVFQQFSNYIVFRKCKDIEVALHFILIFNTFGLVWFGLMAHQPFGLVKWGCRIHRQIV